MSQFYYREDELRKLNKRYAGDKGETNRFMERQVLGQESPLYGRRTGQFKIDRWIILSGRRLLFGKGKHYHYF